MQAIGAYFGLADFENGEFPHKGGILLNTGRNSLEYILRGLDDVKCVFLPRYDCEVVLEPLKRLRIPWRFYPIDRNFEIAEDIPRQPGEYLVVNNYFGIKDAYVRHLAEQDGDRLIVDCAQAFFARPLPGIKSFYSPRKFVGVADGGVAYVWNDTRISVTETECTDHHDSHLLIRKQSGAEAGFASFQENEKKLDNQPIRRMSETTKTILDHIDYDRVITRRRENFKFIHEALGDRNLLHLPDMDTFEGPMVYPFLSEDASLRQRLIGHKIFAATYWPNVKRWAEPGSWEYELADRLIPLPIDQRYTTREMATILDIIA